jgi:hypothetical protein
MKHNKRDHLWLNGAPATREVGGVNGTGREFIGLPVPGQRNTQWRNRADWSPPRSPAILGPSAAVPVKNG